MRWLGRTFLITAVEKVRVSVSGRAFVITAVKTCRRRQLKGTFLITAVKTCAWSSPPQLAWSSRNARVAAANSGEAETL
jgi:hypothetical protein